MAKRIAIVGKALSGEAAARLLGLSREADFVFFDDKKPDAHYQSAEKLLKEFRPTTLLVSPGVPLKTPWIEEFKNAGGEITSELALAFAHLKNERVYGVTGSLGKSTTVGALGAAAQAWDPHAFVGGNFGVPLATYVADLREGNRAPAQAVILELSSYQLENFANLRVEVSAFTYLSSNHLERYPNLAAYYDTKWFLAERTSKAVVYNEKSPDLRTYAQNHTLAGRKIVGVAHDHGGLTSQDFAQSPLLGLHNWDNLALAFEVARQAQWDERFLTGLLSFKGLAHRLEKVGQFRDVLFINDSKATTMESVLTAVAGVVGPGYQTFLLLGGKDKKLPWERLSSLQSRSGLECVFFGECGELAQTKSGLAGAYFPRLRAAMESLTTKVKAGDRVLLSPGGTSLDEFKNFEDRGEQFQKMVREYFSA